MKFDRETYIEMIAEKITDSQDMQTLVEYFYQGQMDWLGDLSDNELIEQAEWVGVSLDEDDEFGE